MYIYIYIYLICIFFIYTYIHLIFLHEFWFAFTPLKQTPNKSSHQRLQCLKRPLKHSPQPSKPSKPGRLWNPNSSWRNSSVGAEKSIILAQNRRKFFLENAKNFTEWNDFTILHFPSSQRAIFFVGNFATKRCITKCHPIKPFKWYDA